MTKTVNFELAKLLEEKGFKKNTKANWWILAKDHDENYKKGLPVDESKIFFTKNSREFDLKTEIDEETMHNVYHVLNVPTISKVIMWLYKKHKIWINVSIGHDEDKIWFNAYIEKIELGYNFDSLNLETDITGDSPEEAYEKAIEYTLKNLI